MTAATEKDRQAAAWLARTGEPAFDDWAGFTTWLEADPAHADAYQALAVAVEDAADALRHAGPGLPATPAPIVRPARARRWIGGALAACLAGMIGWTVQDRRAEPIVIETAIGAQRVVPLADGSRIALNGGTRIVLDPGDARAVRLERGEALFTVVHDAARPFRVVAGGDEIVDVGTVFSVERQTRFTAVQVADGAVVFNPEGEAVRLDAGRGLTSAAGEPVAVGAVAPETVGGWSRGRLDYAGAPLAEVLADVRRATGADIVADRTVAARPFHGTLRLNGVAADPSRLGPLLGVSIRREGGRWRAVLQP